MKASLNKDGSVTIDVVTGSIKFRRIGRQVVELGSIDYVDDRDRKQAKELAAGLLISPRDLRGAFIERSCKDR
jgi:hypothetical protein